MATAQRRQPEGPMDDLSQIAAGAKNLLMRGVSTVKRTIDPNNQLRSLVKGRYDKMIANGLTEKEAVDATLAAVRTSLEAAIAEEKEAQKTADGADRGEGDGSNEPD